MCYMLKTRGKLYQAITLLQMQRQEIEMVVLSEWFQVLLSPC